jgi:predicted DNA-binding transcriptional regulator AlpA
MAKLNSRSVRARYDNPSDMTLWRWVNDDKLNFPKPAIIRGRRYWDEAELDAWDASQAAAVEV